MFPLRERASKSINLNIVELNLETGFAASLAFDNQISLVISAKTYFT